MGQNCGEYHQMNHEENRSDFPETPNAKELSTLLNKKAIQTECEEAKPSPTNEHLMAPLAADENREEHESECDRDVENIVDDAAAQTVSLFGSAGHRLLFVYRASTLNLTKIGLLVCCGQPFRYS